jgi:hypothetical protein
MRVTRALAVIGLLGAACGRDLHTAGGAAGSGASAAMGGTGTGGSGGSGISLEDVRMCDPSVEHLAYVDADGDGEGAPSTAACISNDEYPDGALPDGYAATASDCDDGDVTIGPWVADRPGDGIDRDCDKLDGRVDCAVSPSVCPCATLANQAVEMDPACTRFDVALVGVDACGGGCGSTSHFAVLANRGGAAVTGPIALAWSSGPVVTWLDGLAAGEVSVPIWVPGPPLAGDVLVATALESGDCDPTNDSHAAPQPSAALCAK